MTMVCLSSGKKKRYRDDILRALALPSGTRLKFRYDKDLVEANVWKGIVGNSLGAVEAILAHVDLSDPKKTAGVVPIRKATLVRGRPAGSFLTLLFRLGEFVTVKDEDKWYRALNSPPAFTDGKWQGLWCAAANSLPTLHVGDDPEHWQEVVRAVCRSGVFDDPLPFSHVLSVLGHDRKQLMPGADGAFTLQAGRNYSLELFHYQTFDDEHDSDDSTVNRAVQILAPDEEIDLVSRPLLPLDSDYDIKVVRFRTRPVVRSRRTRLEVQSVVLPQRPESLPDLGYYLEFEIKPAWMRTAGLGLLIGSLLTVQQWITIWSAKGATIGTTIPETVGVAVVGLLTGLAAAFGLRRSI